MCVCVCVCVSSIAVTAIHMLGHRRGNVKASSPLHKFATAPHNHSPGADGYLPGLPLLHKYAFQAIQIAVNGPMSCHLKLELCLFQPTHGALWPGCDNGVHSTNRLSAQEKYWRVPSCLASSATPTTARGVR